MIFLTISWNMCIESNASAVGDTWKFTGRIGDTVYSEQVTAYQEYFYSLFTFENALNYFTPGHTYNLKAKVSCTQVGGTNVGARSAHAYFVTGDEEYYLTSSTSDYFVDVDFNFLYTGGDIGFKICMSVTNYKTDEIGYVRASLNDYEGTGYVFTDLGVISSEYEILERIDDTTTRTQETMVEVDNTTKGIWQTIKDFFGSFFSNLIDSIIGLFIPSEEDMSGLFDQLNQFFSDTFGFLYAPFDYIIQFVDVFLTSDAGTGLVFPGFSIMGQEVWPDMEYDIASDPVAGQVLGYVRIGTGILLAGWFIMYLQDFFKERFGKG